MVSKSIGSSQLNVNGFAVLVVIRDLVSFACLHSSVMALEPAHRLIVGWNNSVIIGGPGTVAGMDSPAALERMVKRRNARGHQVISWPTDEAMLPSRFMTRWVDADIILRSELPYVQIMPQSDITSSDAVGLALVTTADSQPMIDLRTRQGNGHVHDGTQLTDTKVAAAFDAWNHLQLVIDPSSKSSRVILHVIGEAPRLLCRGSLNHTSDVSSPLGVELFCDRSNPHSDGAAFDNQRVTRRLLKGML